MIWDSVIQTHGPLSENNLHGWACTHSSTSALATWSTCYVNSRWPKVWTDPMAMDKCCPKLKSRAVSKFGPTPKKWNMNRCCTYAVELRATAWRAVASHTALRLDKLGERFWQATAQPCNNRSVMWRTSEQRFWQCHLEEERVFLCLPPNSAVSWEPPHQRSSEPSDCRCGEPRAKNSSL